MKRLVFLVLGGLPSPVLPVAAAETPPSIVLLFLDNSGNGVVGFAGSTRHRTPHRDRLAAGTSMKSPTNSETIS